MRHAAPLVLALLAITAMNTPTQARTVWRCVRDGTISLSTAAEPGSRCAAQTLDDNAALLPNLWGKLGAFRATLYQREQDGTLVYGTRNLPGSIKVQQLTVATPSGSPAHVGIGAVGKPQLGAYKREFATAARASGVDEAWLRAIAHAESDYAAQAVSPKGAKGVMQLMPEVIDEYRVADPFSAQQSISAGAQYLKTLQMRYAGDLLLASAAYNAGPGAVAQYGGVPPYAETRDYVAKVDTLYERYRAAMGLPPRHIALTAAQ